MSEGNERVSGNDVVTLHHLHYRAPAFKGALSNAPLAHLATSRWLGAGSSRHGAAHAARGAARPGMQGGSYSTSRWLTTIRHSALFGWGQIEVSRRQACRTCRAVPRPCTCSMAGGSACVVCRAGRDGGGAAAAAAALAALGLDVVTHRLEGARLFSPRGCPLPNVRPLATSASAAYALATQGASRILLVRRGRAGTARRVLRARWPAKFTRTGHSVSPATGPGVLRHARRP